MSNLIKSNSVYIPKEVSNKSRIVYQANKSVMIKNVEDKKKWTPLIWASCKGHLEITRFLIS